MWALIAGLSTMHVTRQKQEEEKNQGLNPLYDTLVINPFPPNIQNRMSKGRDIWRECSPPSLCHMSRVTCHVSHVTCHMSHITCHMSHVSCHMLQDACLNFFLFFLTKLWS